MIRKKIMSIIAFSGHRPPKLGGFYIPNPIFNYICFETERLLKELKPDKCISGLALGYDSYAAKICIKLGIPFIAAIPFEGQERLWKNKSKEEYKYLLDKAEEIIYVCEPGFAKWKFQKRNEYMVDRGNIILACFGGTTGGTYNCVTYAKSKNKEIIIINPKNWMINNDEIKSNSG